MAGFAAAWPPDRLAPADLRMEEKGATLSIHARGSRDPEAARLLMAQVASEALDRGLVPTSGREVLEVRFGSDRNSAVRCCNGISEFNRRSVEPATVGSEPPR